MRVVFDAYWWVEGPLSNQMVQREFITTWLRDYADEAILVVPAADVDRVRAQVASHVQVRGTHARPHALAAAAVLPRIARQMRADVIVSHNFTPLFGRSVTFIHDVLFQTNPRWFTPAERVYLAPIPLLARRADAVATSSHEEAQRIRWSNPRLRQVRPVGLALGTGLTEAHPARPQSMPDVAEFVLTVGRLNVRKNLARTVEAAVSSGSITPERPLLVVGEPDGRTEGLGDDVVSARREGVLVFLDRVDDAELAWLYGNAQLFAFLSLGEGYGLPPLEAMHFGAPTLVSDIPVFHETLGGDAHFVDPRDTAAIAAEFTRLLTAPARPRAATRADVKSSAQDWTACTARLRDIACSVTGRS